MVVVVVSAIVVCVCVGGCVFLFPFSFFLFLSLSSMYHPLHVQRYSFPFLSSLFTWNVHYLFPPLPLLLHPLSLIPSSLSVCLCLSVSVYTNIAMERVCISSFAYFSEVLYLSAVGESLPPFITAKTRTSFTEGGPPLSLSPLLNSVSPSMARWTPRSSSSPSPRA